MKNTELKEKIKYATVLEMAGIISRTVFPELYKFDDLEIYREENMRISIDCAKEILSRVNLALLQSNPLSTDEIKIAHDEWLKMSPSERINLIEKKNKHPARFHTSDILKDFFKPYEEMTLGEKVSYLETENRMLSKVNEQIKHLENEIGEQEIIMEYQVKEYRELEDKFNRTVASWKKEEQLWKEQESEMLLKINGLDPKNKNTPIEEKFRGKIIEVKELDYDLILDGILSKYWNEPTYESTNAINDIKKLFKHTSKQEEYNEVSSDKLVELHYEFKKLLDLKDYPAVKTLMQSYIDCNDIGILKTIVIITKGIEEVESDRFQLNNIIRSKLLQNED